MSTPTAILVPVVENATQAPLVLADSAFLTALANAEQRVGALQIKDVATYQGAASLLNDLSLSAKTLERYRTELKAPFLELGRKIDAVSKGPATRIDNLISKVKAQVATYNEAQRKEAERIERERQAEIARLEKERARQEAEAKAKAEAEAAARAAAAVPADDFDDLDFGDAPEPEPVKKTVIEQKIEELKYAPAAVAPVAQGIAFRVRLVAKVTDVAALPDAFVIRTANERLIRETYCTGYKDGQPVPTLPGVTFVVDRTPIATGKTQEDF